jgi:hypothetical protein
MNNQNIPKKDFFSENYIDKEKYPLEVEYIADENGGYLIEGGDTSKKYKPIKKMNTIHFHPLYLVITPPITKRVYFNALEKPIYELYATTKFSDSSNISFFGTDRKIEELQTTIYSSEYTYQLQFKGNMSTHDLYSSDDDIGGECLYISLSMPKKVLDALKEEIESSNIKPSSIQLKIKKEIINGLYSFEFAKGLKVLYSKEIVKNYKKLPSDFTDFKFSKTYYLEDSYSLIIKKEILTNDKD